MTFGNEGEALVALTTGRATPEDLREIVTRYPHLRATVARYPASDAPLLDWLADLGDPAVSQVVATRNAAPAAAHPAATELTSPATAAAAPASRRLKVLVILVAGAIVLAVVGSLLGYHLLTAPHPATEVIATIPLGNQPYWPAVAPDGTVYVPNVGDDTVPVLR